jgi:hypothetical protein
VLDVVIFSVPSQKSERSHDLSLFWLGTYNISTSNTLVDDLSLFWLGADKITTSNTLVHYLSLKPEE